MGLLGERSLTRRRYAAPTWTAGRPVAGSSSDTAFLGSVQPLRGRDRHVLPDGIRASDGRKVYCDRGTLRVDDQHTGDAADEVVIDGDVFTVVHVDSDHPLLEHDRAYLVRNQEQPVPVEEPEEEPPPEEEEPPEEEPPPEEDP